MGFFFGFLFLEEQIVVLNWVLLKGKILWLLRNVEEVVMVCCRGCYRNFWVGTCLDLPSVPLYSYLAAFSCEVLVLWGDQLRCCFFVSDERSEGCWEEVCPCHVPEEEQRAPQRLCVPDCLSPAGELCQHAACTGGAQWSRGWGWLFLLLLVQKAEQQTWQIPVLPELFKAGTLLEHVGWAASAAGRLWAGYVIQ